MILDIDFHPYACSESKDRGGQANSGVQLHAIIRRQHLVENNCSPTRFLRLAGSHGPEKAHLVWKQTEVSYRLQSQ